MQRRGTYLTLGLVLVLLALAATIAGTKSAVLGLDLRGGAQAIIQVVPKGGNSLTENDVAEAQSVILSRVDALGVSEPEVRREGTDTISVSVAGEKNPQRIFDIVGETGDLYFLDLSNALTPGISRSVIGSQAVSKPNAYSLLAPLQKGKTDADFDGFYAFRKGNGTPLNKSVVARRADVFSDLQVAAVPRSQVVVLGVPKGKLAVSCTTTPNRQCPAAQTGPTGWYMFDLPSSAANTLTGADLSSARADFEQSGAPIVAMNFTDHGRSLFATITKKLAADGRSAYQADPSAYGNDPQNSLRQFAVILDGQFQTAPTIDWQKNPDGINSSSAEITGVSLQEARDVATVLNSGSLKATLLPKSQNVVSATLGKASLNQGLVAGGIGLLVVMIYMLAVYRFLGLIADIALLIYSLLFYALIVQIPVTMTLPGIAGMILTIGVAADANVVIFERIREEVRLGKPVRLAVSHGYSKGFSTIIDANVVTLLTAGILFLVSQATVKGFALLLALGVLVSMFTAVAATRAMLSVLSSFQWFHSAAFMGATARPVRWHFNFMGRTKLWFGISILVIAIGAGSLATRGLNQGIDFKGGTQITYAMPKGKTVSVTAVRDVIAPVNQEFSRVIRGVGSSTASSFNEFQLAGRATDTATLNRIQAALLQKFPGSEIRSREAVSASFGAEIRDAAVYALIFSLLSIIGYVALRFDWKYALPMIISVAHDIVITVGIYSLTGREVTASTVAAVLTIMGYSLYDTIIIFDRVRENEKTLRKHRFSQIVNISLWETTTRSLTTTGLTLLPIISLFFFGGSTLKDFAFALIVGIACGAYSSFFIAAPLLMLMKNREPEYSRRPGSRLLPVMFNRESYGHEHDGLELKEDEVELQAQTPKGTRQPTRRSSRRPAKPGTGKAIESTSSSGATSVLEPPAEIEDETSTVDEPIAEHADEPRADAPPGPAAEVTDDVARRMEEARRRRAERRNRK